MRSARTGLAFAWLALACLAFAAPALAAPRAPKEAAAPELDVLLKQFAKSPGLFARFREEKHLAMLDAPLVNEGTIHFAPPQRLARHTEKPQESTLLIDGTKLQFGDADGHESMDLGTNPVARLFVDSFTMLLEGNRAGLERIFKLQFTPRPHGAWQLALVPRVAPMDKMITGLTLRGEGLVLRDMDLRETSGDSTHTVFTNVDVDHRYGAAELARVFRLPGK